jgi:hypothetical protein
MSENKVSSVIIHGPKEAFNSKAAIGKFKKAVKNGNTDLNNLREQYISNNYVLSLNGQESETISFNINQKVKEEKLNENQLKLRQKITQMKGHRTNYQLHKAMAHRTEVPEEIMTEYQKLSRVSKIPVPEPYEIISNPEQYKPVISMVLNNKFMPGLSSSHPYVRYFKLLAKHIGVNETNPLPMANLEQLQKMYQEKETDLEMPELVKAETQLQSNDADTDSESD